MKLLMCTVSLFLCLEGEMYAMIVLLHKYIQKCLFKKMSSEL